LAAAAYNAGEGRVNSWLSNKTGLPQETRNYVLAITGLPAEYWKAAAGDLQSFKLAKQMPCRGHEAFADADEAPDESDTLEAAKAKTALSTKAASGIPAPLVVSGRIRKTARLSKHGPPWRGRNNGERHALGQERVKATAADAGARAVIA
jgi:hypothetical protein